MPATRHSGKRPFAECQGQGARGRGHLPRVLGLGSRGIAFPIFFKRLRLFAPSNATFLFRVPFFPECCARGRWPSPSAFLPRVLCPFRHSGKAIFPECNSSPSATLGEDCLPRVPDFWHSGKHVALGEFCFSRSEGCVHHIIYMCFFMNLDDSFLWCAHIFMKIVGYMLPQQEADSSCLSGNSVKALHTRNVGLTKRTEYLSKFTDVFSGFSDLRL